MMKTRRSMENSTEIPEPKVGDLPEENSAPSALPDEAVPQVADPAVQEVDVQQAPDPEVVPADKEEPPVLDCEASEESNQPTSQEDLEIPNICVEPEIQNEVPVDEKDKEVETTKVNPEAKMEAETEMTPTVDEEQAPPTEEEKAQSKKRHIEEIVSENVVKKLKTITDGDQVVSPKKVSCEE